MVTLKLYDVGRRQVVRDDDPTTDPPTGDVLRTYRLALITDPGYATFFGGSANVTAAKVTLMNRVDQLYEDDLSIRMVLVANNDLLNLLSSVEVAMLFDMTVGPVDQERCDNCPPTRVCAWDCEQGQGVLEIMMGEALAEQAAGGLATARQAMIAADLWTGAGLIGLIALYLRLFATAGTTFVMTGQWVGRSIVAGVVLGLLAVGLLQVNNIRDIPTDGPVGKKTLAVRIGDGPARKMFAGIIVASIVCAMPLVPWWGLPVLLVCGPVAWLTVRPVLGGASGRDLIRVLQRNSLLEVLVGTILAGSTFLSPCGFPGQAQGWWIR